MSIPLRYNVRSVLQRKSRTTLTILGVAAVVAVFTAMVGLGQGMTTSFAKTGSPDNIVVLQKGAFSQSLSSLPMSSGDVVGYVPHVKTRGDRVFASPELVIEPWTTAPGSPRPHFMSARGVTAAFFAVADSVATVEGSGEVAGNRVLIGRGAQRKLGGVRVGDTIGMFGERWQIGGIFEAGGTNLEFEILADLDNLMRAARRTEISCYTLKLDSPAASDGAIALLESDRRVLLTAMREQDYYASSAKVYAVVAQVGLLVSLIVTLGAVFGGMNTMYTAVAGRMREIGTLRAIGFSRGSVLVSFLAESLLLSLTGGLIGVALGCLANGLRVSVGVANVRFVVGPAALLSGLLLSAAIGVVGGLLPARGAARTTIVEAMRRI